MMPTTPIRWLHLSDFHVGKDKYEERKIHQFILEHVRAQCDTGFIPDLVFITGDIANNGLESEYTEFIDEFLDPLKAVLGGSEWQGHIFSIPGNHDLQRKYVQAVSRDDRLRTDSKFFRADKAGLEERRLHELRAFEEFGNFTILSNQWPENWLDSDSSSLLVKPFTLKDKTVGIIGFNTAWLSRDGKDKEQLSPGIDLLESALQTIQTCDLRILLGHHPVDWFSSKHRARIQNTMADYTILYLHGHLHETRSQPMETGSGKFLQIQAGAAFNVLEHDETKWKNGLLWAEVDLDMTHIRLQPTYWKSDDRRWGISDDLHEDHKVDGYWWAYPLPTTEKYSELLKIKVKKGLESQIDLPEGWKHVDEEYIKARSREDLRNETLLNYFDGAIPMLHREFLRAIPERNAVGDTIKALKKNRTIGRPSLLLLTGAGGEGKSTALLQSTLKLYETGEWNLLWHTLEKAPLPIDSIGKLSGDKPWLIVSDDGDLIIEDLKKLLPWLAQHRTDIHFLIASRKSDWYSAGGTRVGWSIHSTFREITLGKLDLNESKSIVNVWSAFGEAGLKALNGVAPDNAAEKLLKASEDEEGRGEGAFLGAMLKIRMADGLRDHVKMMLSRLSSQKIGKNEDDTLLKAFTAIALMHSEGFDFLSAPVLAQYIFGDPVKSIRGAILSPLGREAAATHAGEFLFTRHTSIAKTAIEVLEKDFGLESKEVYCSLGVAAIEAWKNRAYVPELGKWRYDFPNHFLENHQISTALAIGKVQQHIDPENTLTLNNLASMYRKSELPDAAIRLFREYKGKTNRSFYYEWGTSEGSCNNPALGVWLSATSLSDWRFPPPDNNQAKLSLSGLGVAFSNLYSNHYESAFCNARAACCILGLCLVLDERAQTNFIRGRDESRKLGAPEMTIVQAFKALEDGTKEAWNYLEMYDGLVEQIPAQDKMAFEGLKDLIRRTVARTQK